MPVDKAELANDLATNPEYQTIARENLAKKDFIVRTKEEDTAYQERFKLDVIEKEIPGKIKAVHDQYDQDTKTLFGLDRNPEEKSYDYLKRAAKTKLSEYEGLKTEVETLKKAIEKGDPGGALTQKLQETEAKAATALAEKEKRIKELENESSVTKKESVLQKTYVEIRNTFKKDLPPLFSRSEKYILDDALRSSVLKDGKLYLTDSTGAIVKDAAFNEVTIEAHLAKEFADVIDVTKKQEGTNSKGKNGDENKIADPLAVTADTFAMPPHVTTKDELMTYLIEQGVPRGTKNFNEIWNKFAKPLKDPK